MKQLRSRVGLGFHSWRLDSIRLRVVLEFGRTPQRQEKQNPHMCVHVYFFPWLLQISCSEKWSMFTCICKNEPSSNSILRNFSSALKKKKRTACLIKHKISRKSSLGSLRMYKSASQLPQSSFVQTLSFLQVFTLISSTSEVPDACISPRQFYKSFI